jgi:hypothetical protein
MSRAGHGDTIVRAAPALITKSAARRTAGSLNAMVTVGLLIRLHARPGMERDVETFLERVMPIIRDEPATTALFGVRFGPSEYGIFNAFPDEAGRAAHVSGLAATALFERADELFGSAPSVEAVDILAAKVPGGEAVLR